jgi:hypothetical protein
MGRYELRPIWRSLLQNTMTAKLVSNMKVSIDVTSKPPRTIGWE